MRKTTLSLAALAIATVSAGTALAQGMPTTQPKFLVVYREEIKTGRAADHAKWEAGWPAAFEKAKSKFQYLALSSLTSAERQTAEELFQSQADTMEDACKR